MDEALVQQTQRAVWAAFEARRHLTLDELEELTEIAPGSTLPYLNSLIKNEYVALTGTGRTARGEYMPRFSLINYTGPEAPTPYQNAKMEAENRKSRGCLMLKENPPTPSAKLVAEAMRRNDFTTNEIAEAAGLGDKRAFAAQYLRALSIRGWLIRLDKRKWRMAGVPLAAQCVWNVLKEAAGNGPVGMDKARRFYGGDIPLRSIGFAVDVMRCQGWVIRQGVSEGRGNKMIYQVEKP